MCAERNKDERDCERLVGEVRSGVSRVRNGRAREGVEILLSE